jgi:putative heme-binding domain-containing protein
MRRLLCLAVCLWLPSIAASAEEAPSRRLEPLVRLLASSDDTGLQIDILRGMIEALQGRRSLSAPTGWSAVERRLAASPSPEVREKAILLSVLFGDPEAIASLRKTAADPKAGAASRRTALQMLTEAHAPGLLPLLGDLLGDAAMRGAAIRALAASSDSSVPALLVKHYPGLTDAEKADAVATLASRPAFASALLDAIEKEQVPRRDVSVFIARQIVALNDKRLTQKLEKVWGAIRAPAQDKAQALYRYLALVPPDALKKADRSHGRAVYARTCASCHMLFNEGGKIGPDLTGSQRARPEYVLSKVLDPNAVVARDYQLTLFTTKDGRTLSGIVKEETKETVTLQTPNDVVRLSKADIEERHQSAQSLMPEGQLATLSDAEIRDLIAYLAGEAQAALPPDKPNAPPTSRDGAR